MVNYYDELPEGYEKVWSIDAGDKKAGLLLNLAALGIGAVIVALGVIFKKIDVEIGGAKYFITLFAFVVAMVLYIIIHELTHGLFYKILTHKKLTFGLKLTCAFCGVPEIYSTRKTLLLSALAPFVIYNIPCIIALCLLPGDIIYLAVLAFFALHAGGCIGDIYVSIKSLTFPKNVLINDTGAKQTMYIKK